MDQAMRFQETLRRLAIFDERFVAARSGLDLAGASALDPKTAALLQLGAAVAIGSSAVCLRWRNWTIPDALPSHHRLGRWVAVGG